MIVTEPAEMCYSAQTQRLQLLEDQRLLCYAKVLILTLPAMEPERCQCVFCPHDGDIGGKSSSRMNGTIASCHRFSSVLQSHLHVFP